MFLSQTKVELLKKLQHKEHVWSSKFLTQGMCTTDMISVEREIKSLRNQIKHQDVQEVLATSNP